MQSKGFTKTNEWMETQAKIGMLAQRVENIEKTLNNAIDAFEKLQNTFIDMAQKHNALGQAVEKLMKQQEELYTLGLTLEKRVIAIEKKE